MMTKVEFNCLPTMIGSLPHKDPKAACALVAKYLKDVPAWPQLPRRSFLENMYVQFSEGFPGVVVENEKMYIDPEKPDADEAVEKLYAAYLEKDSDKLPVSKDHAAGLYGLLETDNLNPKAVKGQVTGAISFGLSVSDKEGKPIIYDEILSDAAAKLLRLKAAWQEKQLRRISKKTIIFVDEPYMASYGSAYVALSKEKAVALVEEVLGGISGLKGLHCCGNTDWSIFLSTSADVLSFDTYSYAESLTLYPDAVKKFIDRGSGIAWGIVPNEAELLLKETVASLRERLEEAMAPFTRKGIPFKTLVKQGLLTPCCGVAGLGKEGLAEQALAMLAELSEKIRQRYG